MSGTLHIRYDGQSLDMAIRDLDVGDLSTDQDVRQAVSTHLSNQGVDAPLSKLNQFRVDRNEDDITLRPNATFGC